jgi:addiction module HigA family antidote
MPDVMPNTTDLLDNEHPGGMLKEDFLDPLGITPYRLAKSLGLTPIHVSDILHGRRAITPATSLLLGKFFGLSPSFWLTLQSRHDLIAAQRVSADRLARVTPYADLSRSVAQLPK